MRTGRLLVTMVMTLALLGAHAPGRAQPRALPPVSAPPRPATSTGGVILPQAALQPSRSVRRLSVDEAVTLALEQNLDLQVERINPLVQNTLVAEAQSVYAPILSSMLTGDDWDRPAGHLRRRRRGYEPLRAGQRGHRAAGALEGRPVLSGMERPTIDHDKHLHELQPSAAVELEPELHPAAGANFGIDDFRQRIAVTRANRDLSDIELRRTVVSNRAHRPQRLLAAGVRAVVPHSRVEGRPRA